jgi:hypothetical protein
MGALRRPWASSAFYFTMSAPRPAVAPAAGRTTTRISLPPPAVPPGALSSNSSGGAGGGSSGGGGNSFPATPGGRPSRLQGSESVSAATTPRAVLGTRHHHSSLPSPASTGDGSLAGVVPPMFSRRATVLYSPGGVEGATDGFAAGLLPSPVLAAATAAAALPTDGTRSGSASPAHHWDRRRGTVVHAMTLPEMEAAAARAGVGAETLPTSWSPTPVTPAAFAASAPGASAWLGADAGVVGTRPGFAEGLGAGSACGDMDSPVAGHGHDSFAGFEEDDLDLGRGSSAPAAAAIPGNVKVGAMYHVASGSLLHGVSAVGLEGVTGKKGEWGGGALKRRRRGPRCTADLRTHCSVATHYQCRGSRNCVVSAGVEWHHLAQGTRFPGCFSVGCCNAYTGGLPVSAIE